MKDVWQSPLVFEETKFMLCSIPKVGSTEWRQIFLSYHRRNLQANEYRVHWAVLKLPHALHFPVPTVNAWLTDPAWRSVIFVRHPIPRLLSAYTNKFIKNAYAPTRYFRANITFDEFMYMVSRQRHDDMWSAEGKSSFSGIFHFAFADEHWRRQSQFCGAMNLDYEVAHLERVGEFVHSLLESGHLPKRILEVEAAKHFYNSMPVDTHGNTPRPEVNTARLSAASSTALIAKYYSQETLALAKEIYAVDMERFGYDPDEFDEVVTREVGEPFDRTWIDQAIDWEVHAAAICARRWSPMCVKSYPPHASLHSQVQLLGKS